MICSQLGIHLTQVRAVGGISWDGRAHSSGGLPPRPSDPGPGCHGDYLSEVDTPLFSIRVYPCLSVAKNLSFPPRIFKRIRAAERHLII